MLKRVILAVAATAIVAAAMQPANAATATAPFDVNATVNTIATLTFDTANYTWNSTTNTNAALPSTQNSGTGVYSLRGTFGVAPSIIFSAPATIAGTHADSIPVSTFSYACSEGAAPVNGAGGAVAATYSNGGMTTSNACAAFPNGASVAPGASFKLDLFLDEQTISADTYSTTGGAFVITLTAN